MTDRPLDASSRPRLANTRVLNCGFSAGDTKLHSFVSTSLSDILAPFASWGLCKFARSGLGVAWLEVGLLVCWLAFVFASRSWLWGWMLWAGWLSVRDCGWPSCHDFCRATIFCWILLTQFLTWMKSLHCPSRHSKLNFACVAHTSLVNHVKRQIRQRQQELEKNENWKRIWHKLCSSENGTDIAKLISECLS